MEDFTIDTIIPVYNGASFILDAIVSVEAQTYKPSRIIVVNDGSTDDTERIIKEYQANCTIPLTYITQPNAGPNAARNAGLAVSTAPYVAFLDADDIWLPTKLAEQIALFQKKTFPNLGLVYARYDVIDTNKNNVADAYIVPLDQQIKGNAFTQLLTGNKILGSASNVLIQKEVFSQVGNFDESLYMGEDWDMWLRIAEKFDIDYVDAPLVQIRRHTSNQTQNMHKVLNGELLFYKKWIPRIAGRYPIPTRWADVIALHALLQIKHGSFATIKTILSKESRNILFKKTGGSLLLYCVMFIIRKAANPHEWKKVFAKIKSYHA